MRRQKTYFFIIVFFVMRR